ncbi:branched-chain-amino-acid transaminase [Aureococcus anophagefferens]|nr:branched-chain-amino-acid transaminase [Aureococcus anophagefferens]
MTLALLALTAVGVADALSTISPAAKPLTIGAQNLDWANIGFEFRETRSFVRFQYRDGSWDDGAEYPGGLEATVPVSIGATALHYGQSLFEGLKAFACADGSVRLFRPDANAARMANGADRTLMAAPPADLFIEACSRAVRANLDYVPPYGSGGALYVRPLLYGAGPRIGLQPSDAYDLLVLVTPVGDYYKGGLGKPVAAKVVEGFDRAAPLGVGSVKLAGNYAPDLKPNMEAKEAGYPIGLYLDAKERAYVEEFSTSNFVGIRKDSGAYVTPREIVDGEFAEAAACGTAVVLTPVGTFAKGGEEFVLDAHVEPGPTCLDLYTRLTDIQKGDAPDEFGWTHVVVPGP